VRNATPLRLDSATTFVPVSVIIVHRLASANPVESTLLKPYNFQKTPCQGRSPRLITVTGHVLPPLGPIVP
jgi:hypothetical protein